MSKPLSKNERENFKLAIEHWKNSQKPARKELPYMPVIQRYEATIIALEAKIEKLQKRLKKDTPVVATSKKPEVDIDKYGHYRGCYTFGCLACRCGSSTPKPIKSPWELQ